MRKFIVNFIRYCGLGNFPVTVRSGFNKGMKWTFFPWTSYWRGTHETSLQAAIQRTPNLKGKCCWDLGAHYGFYSIGFSNLVGSAGHVFAFEPSISAFDKLEKHKSLNSLEQLTIFNAAVSDISGTKELLRYDSQESTTSHFAFSEESTENVPFRAEVMTYALDDLVRDEKLLLPNVIKIDVEGHGHMALKGGIESILRSRPLIYMGVHCREEKQAIEDLLLTAGYIAQDEQGNVLNEVPLFGDIVLLPPKRDDSTNLQ